MDVWILLIKAGYLKVHPVGLEKPPSP
jgi:hypothetical protein